MKSIHVSQTSQYAACRLPTLSCHPKAFELATCRDLTGQPNFQPSSDHSHAIPSYISPHSRSPSPERKRQRERERESESERNDDDEQRIRLRLRLRLRRGRRHRVGEKAGRDAGPDGALGLRFAVAAAHSRPGFLRRRPLRRLRRLTGHLRYAPI